MTDIITKNDLKLYNLDELTNFKIIENKNLLNLKINTEIIIELGFANQINNENHGGYFKGFLADKPELYENIYYFILKKNINDDETVKIDTWGSCYYSVKKQIQVNYEEFKRRECTGKIKKQHIIDSKKTKMKNQKKSKL